MFPHISTCLNSFTTEVTATRSVIHLKARAHLYIPEVLPQKANHFSAGAEKSPDTPTQVGGGSGWWLSVVGVRVGGVGGWGSHLYNRCVFACVFACLCVSQTQV